MIQLEKNRYKWVISLFTFLLFLVSPQGLTLLVLYFSIIFLTESFVASKFQIQRLAVAASLPLIAATFYLLLRGLVTANQIHKIDFYIFLFLYLIFFYILSRIAKRKESTTSNPRVIFSAFSTFLILVSVQIYLKSKSIGYSVAWVSGGDNRNHVVFIDQLVREGHLNLSTFLLQPIAFPSFHSLVFAGIDKSNLTGNQILSAQLEFYSWAWVLILGTLGVAFAATAQIIWSVRGEKEKDLPFTFIIFAALIPLSALISGPATLDGFITALSCTIFLTLITNWLIEFVHEEKPTFDKLLIGFVLFFGSALSWMFVAPLTFGIFYIALRHYLQIKKSNKLRVDIFLISLLMLAALLVHFSNSGQSLIYNAKVALSVSGSINAQDPNFYYALIVFTFLAAYLNRRLNRNLAISLYWIGIAHFLAILFFKYFSNLSLFTWNYYSLKLQWISVSSLSGILIVGFVYKIFKNIDSKFLFNKRIDHYGILILLLLSFYFVSESLVPTKNVWMKVMRGWENPRSEIMDKVLDFEIDFNNPTLFFHHGYHGDSMLGNFWLNAYANPIDPVRGWNYTIDTLGDVAQVCDVNAYYPKVTLITYDNSLAKQLREECPQEEFTIILERSPF